MARIAVVCVPFYSHVAAAMRLTRTIAGHDHEVAVWGPQDCRDLVTGLGVSYRLHEPQMPQRRGPGYVAELSAITATLTEPLVEELFAFAPDLLLHDSQTPWARVAADYLGVPRVVMHPMFPIVSSRRKPSPSDPWMMSDPDAAIAEFHSHWASIADRWGVELESPECVIHSPAETRIAFTTEALILDETLDPGWHFTGPLMSPPPPPSPAGDRPLVYACFGTAFNRRIELFHALIKGLADDRFDVLVSTGDAPGLDVSDLEPLPDNVTVRSFVPAREVLTRASVHITHGGCNSVHESLIAGVPMVCIPQGYDQFVLARNVELLGAGVIADEAPDDIRAAVRLLLASHKAHLRAQALSHHLITYDGERRVGELIDRILTEDGQQVT